MHTNHKVYKRVKPDMTTVHIMVGPSSIGGRLHIDSSVARAVKIHQERDQFGRYEHTASRIGCIPTAIGVMKATADPNNPFGGATHLQDPSDWYADADLASERARQFNEMAHRKKLFTLEHQDGPRMAKSRTALGGPDERVRHEGRMVDAPCLCLDTTS
jgi:hypothetical protein